MNDSSIQIVQQTSPHLRRRDSLTRMMVDVLIALAPVVIFDLVYFGLDAVRNILLSVAVMALCEFIYVLIKNRIPYDGEHHKFGEQLMHGLKAYDINNFLVPAISGIIFAMCIPAKTTNPTWAIYFIIIVGCVFGMVIGKLVFGGTGHNIFNPAVVGFIFTKECFGSFYDSWAQHNVVDVNTSGTFLGKGYLTSASPYSKFSLLDLFLGNTYGTMGEISKYCILIGLAYLLIRRTIDWRVVVSYLGTFCVLMLFAGIIVHVKTPEIGVFQFLGYQLLSGGVLFGATYMLTDPVTMPITRPSRIMYGMIAAVATVFIRLFVNGFNYVYEGVAFSILIANMFAPVLDYPKWSTNAYTWKNILAMALIGVVSIAIVLWALSAKVGLNEPVSSESSSSIGTTTSADGSTGPSEAIRLILDSKGILKL